MNQPITSLMKIFESLFDSSNSLTTFDNLIKNMSTVNLDIYSLEIEIRQYENNIKELTDSINCAIENKNKMLRLTINSKLQKDFIEKYIADMTLDGQIYIQSLNKRYVDSIYSINKKLNELLASLEKKQNDLEKTCNLFDQEVIKVNSTAKFDYKMKTCKEGDMWEEYCRYNDYVSMCNLHKKIMDSQNTNNNEEIDKMVNDYFSDDIKNKQPDNCPGCENWKCVSCYYQPDEEVELDEEFAGSYNSGIELD